MMFSEFRSVFYECTSGVDGNIREVLIHDDTGDDRTMIAKYELPDVPMVPYETVKESWWEMYTYRERHRGKRPPKFTVEVIKSPEPVTEVDATIQVGGTTLDEDDG